MRLEPVEQRFDGLAPHRIVAVVCAALAGRATSVREELAPQLDAALVALREQLQRPSLEGEPGLHAARSRPLSP